MCGIATEYKVLFILAHNEFVVLLIFPQGFILLFVAYLRQKQTVKGSSSKSGIINVVFKLQKKSIQIIVYSKITNEFTNFFTGL